MTGACAVVVSAALLISSAGSAFADSCWNHNGSVMRLTASGSHREFLYERPKASMRSLVRRGTLLFDGEKTGNRYSGTARVFSNGCAPLEYSVQGPVASSQLKVTVTGTREVYSQCQPTGRMKTDTLVFTWIGDC